MVREKEREGGREGEREREREGEGGRGKEGIGDTDLICLERVEAALGSQRERVAAVVYQTWDQVRVSSQSRTIKKQPFMTQGSRPCKGEYDKYLIFSGHTNKKNFHFIKNMLLQVTNLVLQVSRCQVSRCQVSV